MEAFEVKYLDNHKTNLQTNYDIKWHNKSKIIKIKKIQQEATNKQKQGGKNTFTANKQTQKDWKMTWKCQKNILMKLFSLQTFRLELILGRSHRSIRGQTMTWHNLTLDWNSALCSNTNHELFQMIRNIISTLKTCFSLSCFWSELLFKSMKLIIINLAAKRCFLLNKNLLADCLSDWSVCLSVFSWSLRVLR